MINKDYLTGKIKTVFGNKITDIEGWHDALNSSELYIPHHVLEWKYTSDELKQMNRYYDVPADELIWMPQSVHKCNRYIHKGYQVKDEKQKGKTLKPHNTESKIKASNSKRKKDGFAILFYNHYGKYSFEDIKFYNREKLYFYRHNKTPRWEF
jgi:hypothetical protein